MAELGVLHEEGKAVAVYIYLYLSIYKMGFKKSFSAALGSWCVVFWEGNIKKAGGCWEGQVMILIVQEDKHRQRLIQMK